MLLRFWRERRSRSAGRIREPPPPSIRGASGTGTARRAARNLRGARPCARNLVSLPELAKPPVDPVSGGVATRDRCRRHRRDASHPAAPPAPQADQAPTLLEAGHRWLASYVATTRNP